MKNKPRKYFYFEFQDDEHIGDVYQDEAKQAAMLLYRDKTDDALVMVRGNSLTTSCTWPFINDAINKAIH